MTTPGQQLTPGDDQNPPTFGVPDGAYVGTAGQSNSITDLNNLTEAEAKSRMQGQIAPSFNRQRDSVWDTLGGVVDSIFSDIALALFPHLGGPQPAIDKIHDGQLDLRNRLDLVEGISGYAVAYMRENRFKDRNKWVLMEFNGQVGPTKNASVTNNGITLAQGTWVINAQCTHDQHVDRMTSCIRIEILRPNGTQYSIKEAYGEVFPDKWTTRQVSHNVVIPGPGYRVRVWTYYNVGTFIGVYNRLLWLGGTHLTHLMAHRLDLDASNAVVEENVPTVGSSSGDDG